MTAKLTFKQGATFSLSGTCLLPASNSPWTATCQIRDGGDGLVGAPSVQLAPLAQPTATATHSVLISTADSTADWSGKLYADVLYTDGTSKVPSDTFEIDVVAAVTR